MFLQSASKPTTAVSVDQKGLYYAAKMFLKFHKKLDNKGDDIYNELKTLHQIRKVMSESGKETAATIKAELEGLKAKLRGYTAAIDRLEKKGVFKKQQLESLQFMRGASSAEQKQRVDTAIENLDKEINTEMSRLNLLQSFVPTAGFWKVNKEQYKEPKDVLALLERWGPFYTGGSVVASRKNIKATGKMAGATPILSVEEFETKGSHAIVVIGATDSTVYYNNTQKTDNIRSMNPPAFHKTSA
jgi:hypothetical protein